MVRTTGELGYLTLFCTARVPQIVTDESLCLHLDVAYPNVWRQWRACVQSHCVVISGQNIFDIFRVIINSHFFLDIVNPFDENRETMVTLFDCNYIHLFIPMHRHFG